jgi:hypothetical protein
MSQDRNPFGGGNRQSLYVPMSEVEQEVVARLVESGDLRVVIVGWGYIANPRITFGDARLSIVFRLNFEAPEPPGIPVYYFDLELRTGTGILLFKERQSVMYGGKPVMAAAGVYFDLVWDIAIAAIDPNLVKAIKPGAKGLTTRLQDRDTGQLTVEGNMRLDSTKRHLIRHIREGESKSRADTDEKTAKAEAAEKRASKR